MQLYNNTLCIAASYLIKSPSNPKGLFSKGTYKSMQARKKIKVIRRGCYRTPALIEFKSIPEPYKQIIKRRFDENKELQKLDNFIAKVHKDYKAIEFFTKYRYDDGSSINTNGKINNIALWSNNAALLNAIKILWMEHVSARAALGKRPVKSIFFRNVSELIKDKNLLNHFEHNLPKNARKLAEKFDDYLKNGYIALVKRYNGNHNALKVSDKHLKLLEFIASMPTRPFNTKVVEIYSDFINGEIDLINEYTGEVYNREDYLNAYGEPVIISESTVWHHLNKPDIQIRLDKKRYGNKDYNDIHRPHHHRTSPRYSLSKISMDDRDLIWRDRTTKKRVKAYYAYDVMSGCRIGSAYSKDKNEKLFLDCLRDVFVFCDRNKLGLPLELEVENHLVNKFFAVLKQMFPYVTICAPGNSQQKRAEHLNRTVKYTVEKNNHPGVGRWWLKSKYNRIGVDKVDDKFKEKLKDADRMIADDIQDTLEYNNQLHPNQKRFPGMTRLEVLISNTNPDLPKIDKRIIYKYIGFETSTSIVRNQYVNVQYAKYVLPDPLILKKLKPNNRRVKAYWIPKKDGEIEDIFLYQDESFICKCSKLKPYNEAIAERDEEDLRNKLQQDKYIAVFDKESAKEKGESSNISVFQKLDINTDIHVEILNEEPPKPKMQKQETTNYSKKAISDFFTN